MMWRVAWRSLMTRPIRAGVLAAGFGFGIAVMVELLGVGHVILEQAHAPALLGGGDLLLSGPFGPVSSARYVISTLRAPDLSERVTAISATRRGKIFLITPRGAIPVSATGGIPSLEQSIGDPEVSAVAAWADAPGDERWSRPQPGDVLRAIDRFHPIPAARASSSSWAEWLYFNGRTADGRIRVYVTFLVGPPAAAAGKRQAGVRMQLEYEGRTGSYAATGEVDEAAVLAGAPDLDIAGNRVRLEGSSYRMTLAVAGQSSGRADPARGTGRSGDGALDMRDATRPETVSGEIVLEAAPQRSLAPASIRGAGGWVSGYVVPVLSGRMRGTLRVGRESIEWSDATGYHDHNWGFWEGVRWQWGQVAHDDLSVVYGRVFPPPDVADPARIPGFLAVLGPDGPLGFSSNVTIDDTNERRIDVRTAAGAVDLRLSLSVDETVRTAMVMTRVPGRQPMTFFQLGGAYRVEGRVAGRDIDFTARGSAETFKPQ
jgi:hypothetical protein